MRVSIVDSMPVVAVIACLLTAAIVVTAAPAQARTMFRCKGSIIDTGLTAVEVRARCGEPDLRTVESVPVRARSSRGGTYVVGTATIERWRYQRGPGEFPVELTFEEGELKKIEFRPRD